MFSNIILSAVMLCIAYIWKLKPFSGTYCMWTDVIDCLSCLTSIHCMVMPRHLEPCGFMLSGYIVLNTCETLNWCQDMKNHHLCGFMLSGTLFWINVKHNTFSAVLSCLTGLHCMVMPRYVTILYDPFLATKTVATSVKNIFQDCTFLLSDAALSDVAYIWSFSQSDPHNQ